ncbi:MAG: hypothetical protein CVV46_09295 [Spirochaetae bacterium HGW-Spirochaetae-2]|nr:MAG: hypothetical protein CVV46_09295 [Spirochaetae bacterium HGW-Spirochaetae-2]
MVKVLTYLNLIILLLMLVSCGPVPMERLGMANLSVSAEQRSARSSSFYERSIRATEITDDQFYKNDRKQASRGTLLHQLTPQSFILDIDDVVVYNRLGPDAYLSHTVLQRVNGPAGIVPKHYDLVHANGIIRDAWVQNAEYDGISMQFLPGEIFVSSRNSTTNDGFYVLSITGVELPEEYDGIQLAGEIIDDEKFTSGLRYFSFNHLQPIEVNEGFFSYLTIGSDVGGNWVQNPQGEIGTWVNPVTITNGNAIALYLASDTKIDISSFEDPELLLQWDMQDLVEIWDNGTSDNLSDDIVTYNLSNPFPVSLAIQENYSRTGSSSDTTASSDVTIAAISGQNSVNTLQWLNPQDEDFNEVSIIRKADSAPSDRSDGEEVYRSHIPNFIDTTGTSGVHYYYLIQTVDYSGNYSTGIVLDQVQP